STGRPKEGNSPGRRIGGHSASIARGGAPSGSCVMSRAKVLARPCTCEGTFVAGKFRPRQRPATGGAISTGSRTRRAGCRMRVRDASRDGPSDTLNTQGHALPVPPPVHAVKRAGHGNEHPPEGHHRADQTQQQAHAERRSCASSAISSMYAARISESSFSTLV